jgi:hypothetical protein
MNYGINLHMHTWVATTRMCAICFARILGRAIITVFFFDRISVRLVSNCWLERKYLQAYQQENKRNFGHWQEIDVNLKIVKGQFCFLWQSQSLRDHDFRNIAISIKREKAR